ncbi:MAG: Lrp/AsnC family transcriptional regulator [Candidatus Aenigmatarchaeota archaeon]
MLDDKDWKIISVLKKNSKLSTQQIAKKTLIPTTTIHNRIKKLEKTGVIKNYTIVLDDKKAGKNISAYILLTVDYKLLKEKGVTQHEIAKMLKNHEFVEEVSMITGRSDIVIRIKVNDVEELDTFITKYLRNMDGVEKTETMMILSSF